MRDPSCIMSAKERKRFKLTPLYSSYCRVETQPIPINSDSRLTVSISRGTKRKRKCQSASEASIHGNYYSNVSEIQPKTITNRQIQTFIENSKENFGFSRDNNICSPQQMTKQPCKSFDFNENSVAYSETRNCVSAVTHATTSSCDTVESGAKQVKRAKRFEKS